MSVFLFLLIISYFSRFALPIPKSILDQNSQDVRMQEYTIDNYSNLLDRTNEEYWRLNEKTLSNKCVISPLFSANIDDPKGVITPPPLEIPFYDYRRIASLTASNFNENRVNRSIYIGNSRKWRIPLSRLLNFH